MRAFIVGSLLSAVGASAATQGTPGQEKTPTAAEILRLVDDTMTFTTRVTDAEMVVFDGKAEDVKKLKVWARGQTDSYVEFLAPVRDKGIKYLKLDDNLYMYLPRTEKVVKISGHMLRQGLMDSDFSYEDMLESRAFLTDYNGKVVGQEERAGEMCWVLELEAKRDDVTYQRRKMWVGQETHVPRVEQRFAKSGTLLKESTAGKIVTYGRRSYPTEMTMRDALKSGTHTVFRMSNVTFDTDVPQSLFSRRNLMRQR